ncbi:MAG: oxidoreductase [Steroidobacteraceae bacterium]
MHILQSPIGSGFGPASTAADVMRGIDLTGKIAIVTGGYSGLGRETARTFLSAGARVIVPARDVGRAAAALEGIGGVEIEAMDLLDPASIAAFAARFLAAGQPLHILVNNAGIMAVPKRTLDARGYELHFATNHLGHFQLTAQLWPALERAQGARVVSVSSMGHRFSPVVFDDIHFEHRPYDPWAAYGQSKTANILFALELDERGKADDVRAFSLHPGSILGTGLERHVPIENLKAAGLLDEHDNPIRDPSKGLKTIPQGAATHIWCATSPQLDGRGGVYCTNVDIATLRADNDHQWTFGDSLSESGVWPHAIDRESAARLWKISRQMTGAEPCT